MNETGAMDTMDELDTRRRDYLEAEGYRHVRKMTNGHWVGVLPMLMTHGLFVGLTRDGYRYRFCFEHREDAGLAALCFEEPGDPIGPWIKEKGERGERLGPGVVE